MFRKFALPYQMKIVDSAKKAGLKVVLWNEGDIIPILEDEVKVPCEAFAFEQSRKGIDLSVKSVREAYGKSRCLFGNIDSELLLKRNNPEEIKNEVNSQIIQSGKGCPFVVSTGSHIPSDIEPDAVDAMIKAVRDFQW